MSHRSDVLVIGAGIAGASLAARLSSKRKITVLEAEERPGYHSTGRSAAAFEPNYGPAPIRALTRASRRHFDEVGALLHRESLFVMPAGQEEAFATLMANQQGMHEISLKELAEKYPRLRPDYALRAILDPGTADIDVDIIHQGFLRQLKANGGHLVCDAEATAIERRAGVWRVTTRQGEFEADILVNAAGAWGDVVGIRAGAAPRGLQPKRRSIAVVPVPPELGSDAWPFICDAGETWYAKPQSGKLLVSPADATPVEPHDAFADDMTLAEGIDRFQQAVDVEVSRVEHSWAGLRSFVADGNPVCGYDGKVENFFWLIGQGGYGIQTSPAFSRLAATLVLSEPVPADIADEGLVLTDIAPSRLG
jgi:D-arginine dehydrogenase